MESEIALTPPHLELEIEMTEKELQELSRQAAGKLPDDIQILCGLMPNYSKGIIMAPLGEVKWLHESTEACTEILARVVGPHCEEIVFAVNAVIIRVKGDYVDQGRNMLWFMDFNNDPMLAFRVAVLRALIAT